MDVKESLNAIMDESGISRYAIAKSLGKNQNFIYTMMGRPSNPSYETITSIADVCGYDLALVKRDGTNTIVLDKPDE